MELDGKVAVVTGGTRGVGAGIARSLVAAGAKVLLCARRPPEVAVPGTEFIQLDVRDGDAVRRVLTALPRLDILVNNAGG
ncbi:SDR family NAD(P)-dependent oxidoreductase, partial [Streptomyces bobili]